MVPTDLSSFMLCTDAPDSVTVCPMFAVENETFAITLTITDDSNAPASALTVNATGLLDYEVTIPFSEPVLPMEAVIFPSVVVVAREASDATVFTLEVNAENYLEETVNVLSANFSYPPCESPAYCIKSMVSDATTAYLSRGKFCKGKM